MQSGNAFFTAFFPEKPRPFARKKSWVFVDIPESVSIIHNCLEKTNIVMLFYL